MLGRRSVLAGVLLWALWLILTGCTTFEVGIEPDTATTAELRATADALSARVATLETQIAAAPTPEPSGAEPPEPDLDEPDLDEPDLPDAEIEAVIAYVEGGDIWVQPVPTGEPWRLTEDGRNHTPRWSPSREWLTYSKDGEIWITRWDGTDTRPIADATEAVWSPTDDRLAYIQDEQILAVVEPAELDDTEPGELGDPIFSEEEAFDEATATISATLLFHPAWNPAGTALAYTLLRTVEVSETISITYVGLWSSAVDTDEQAVEHYGIAAPTANLLLAAWLPTGDGVLFWDDPNFAVSLGEDYRALQPALLRFDTEEPQPRPIGIEMVPAAAFAATATETASLVLVGGDGVSTLDDKRLFLVDSSTGDLQGLTDDATVAFAPALAPSGSALAYVAAPAGGELDDRRIWVLREQDDGFVARQITSDPAYRDEHPRWSADGSQVLFARLNQEGQASLWLIPAEGGAAVQVVDVLTPAPEWFGNEGTIDWGRLFDW